MGLRVGLAAAAQDRYKLLTAQAAQEILLQRLLAKEITADLELIRRRTMAQAAAAGLAAAASMARRREAVMAAQELLRLLADLP